MDWVDRQDADFVRLLEDGLTFYLEERGKKMAGVVDGKPRHNPWEE